MHILSLHAHPDDAEILAGGTLALLAARGHRITIATMTPGDKGTSEYSPDEIAAMRRTESAEAAAMIGAEYLCLEFRDLEIFIDNPSRKRIVECLRQTRPDIVLTSAPFDYMCDHEATSALVRDAMFASSAPNYRTDANPPAKPLDGIPHLYYMDPVGGGIAPDFIVDVGTVFELKKKMLACHRSQRNWLMQQHGMDDYLISMETWTRARGTNGGIEFAEGFRQYTGHPYPQSPALQGLLNGLLRP